MAMSTLCNKCALVLGGPWKPSSPNDPCQGCTKTISTPSTANLSTMRPEKPFAVLCNRCARLLGGTASSSAVPCDGCGNLCAGLQWKEVLTQTSTAIQQRHQQRSAISVPYTNYPAQFPGVVWRSPYIPAPILPRAPHQSWQPIQHWASASAFTPAPMHSLATPLPPDRPPPPKHIVLPRADANSTHDRQAIPYQTLALLLEDLNRLLCTPHEGRAFDFCGSCAVVVAGKDDFAKYEKDNDNGQEAAMRGRVMSTAWEVLDRTVIAFDVHKLTVHASSRVAVAKTKSSAIWMGAGALSDASILDGAGKGKTEKKCPCARCEHLLTISVMVEQRKYAVGVSMLLNLVHFAT